MTKPSHKSTTKRVMAADSQSGGRKSSVPKTFDTSLAATIAAEEECQNDEPDSTFMENWAKTRRRTYLCIDAGSKHMGWALLTALGEHRTVLMQGRCTPDHMRFILAESVIDPGIDGVIIEKPDRVFGGYAAKTVPETCYLAGMLSGAADELGLEVHTITAEKARKAVFGRIPKKLNGEPIRVDQYVALKLGDMVERDSEGNEHSRDAIVAGLAVLKGGV